MILTMVKLSNTLGGAQRLCLLMLVVLGGPAYGLLTAAMLSTPYLATLQPPEMWLSCTQVYANGATSRTILKSPIRVCNSLVYVTDTVLLF